MSKESGLNREEAYTHVGECMEFDNVIFTDGHLYRAMHNTYLAAQKALQDFPEASVALAKHFGIKE